MIYNLWLIFCIPDQQMAKGMALQLGLSTDPGLRSNIGEHGRNQLRATWSSVVHLNSLASSCKLL